MKAIVIGAGRGKRLGQLTQDIPKPLLPVLGRPILESILEALEAGGFVRPEVVFVCGYRAEAIERAYPMLRYVHNRAWASNNILVSLMCAREHMGGGFVSSYADIVYRPAIVRALVASPHDLVLACDTDWRRRYAARSEHPESDAEKVRLDGDRVVEISRHVPASEAPAEFIGVMKASAAGAARLCAAYDALRARAGEDGAFREGRSLRAAYLVDLLQELLEQGEPLHCIRTPGGYMEIDTPEDATLAESWWRGP
ncbi:MAG: phosphocholine cytidylyltransferase family protein [Deltaproteobacteria bacterium]|nr:phosphocholine cytidylyltransferase family protein [Deltaproteobacteria bacterium]